MKKKILSLCSIVVISFLMIINVNALEITKSGDNVVQTGEYDSLRLVAGESVTNKASVKGLSLIAGNRLDLQGKTPYGLYAGNIITINEKVEKDMFVAGNNIKIDKDAVLKRDVYIAGRTVKIDANIKRDLRLASESVDLSDITIGGDAYITADEIIVNEKTIIKGKLTYPEDVKIKGLSKASIGSIKTTKYEVEVEEKSLIDYISSFIFSSIASFLVMIVLFYLVQTSKEKLDNIELKPNNIAKTVGIGLIVLIIVPIISIIALFTAVLTPLALITLAIYVIGIYLSSLLVYYIVGSIVTPKLLKKDNVYLELIIGIILVKIIKLIPYIGGLVSFVVLLYGLGLIYKFIQSRGK